MSLRVVPLKMESTTSRRRKIDALFAALKQRIISGRTSFHRLVVLKVEPAVLVDGIEARYD